MKKSTFKGITAGILAGAVTVCSIPAIAKSIDAVMNSVNIRLDGEKVASIDESYELQNGAKVPYSILYEGTTYLPIRKVSELLDISIDWENESRTVLIESGKNDEDTAKNTDTYDSWYGVPDFGEFYGIKEFTQSPNIRSTTHWYDIKSVSKVTGYTDLLEEEGYERVTDSGVKSKFKVYKKGNIEVWMDVGMYTKLAYGVTVVDTSRPITGRDYGYSGSNEEIPNFASAFGYEPKIVGGRHCHLGDFHLWSCIPDYLSLLEQEGFSVINSDSSFYGKNITLRKNRSTVLIYFDGTEYSDIPAFIIDY